MHTTFNPTTPTATRGNRFHREVLMPRHIGARDPAAARPLIARRLLRIAQRRIPKPPLFTAADSKVASIAWEGLPLRPSRSRWRSPTPRLPQGSCLLAAAPASREPVQPERAPHSPVELITTGQRKIRGPRSALAAAQQTKGPKRQKMKGISGPPMEAGFLAGFLASQIL